MNIYAEPGTKVKFVEQNVSESSITYRGDDDPRGVLFVGQEYIIDHTEVHSYHTKVFLKGYPGKSFNSVWFE